MTQTETHAHEPAIHDDDEHLINGEDVNFEYGDDEHDHSTSTLNKRKKKKKKSKTKNTLTAGGVPVSGVEIEDPDMDYPESRLLKRDPTSGDVIVQSLDSAPSTGTKKSVKKAVGKFSASPSNGVTTQDPLKLNDELKKYWESLNLEEKKELLNMERDSVFRVMREQQKITCNCTVCGRKRKIIEDELTKLYDSYYERIEHDKNFTGDLFHPYPTTRAPDSAPPSQPHVHQHGGRKSKTTQHQPQQQQQVQQQQPVSAEGFSPENARRNGIMSVAEDLLQNDGKKFLEMMEKLAESRIKRQTELLKRPDLMGKNTNHTEEEENSDYNHDDDEGHFHHHSSQLAPSFSQSVIEDDTSAEPYLIPPLPEIELPDDPVSFYFDESAYNEEEDEDYVEDSEEEDSYGEYSDESDEELLQEDSPADFHEALVELLRDQSDYFAKEAADLRASTSEYDRQLLQKLHQRQQSLQRQLQRERQELRNLQVNYIDEVGKEYEGLDEDLDDYDDDEDEDEDDEEDEEDDEDEDLIDDDEDDIDEDDEEEEFSDDAVDEESQLQEGRTMLQLCTTKMLRQSLLKSYKEKKIEEQQRALLAEEEAARERERRKEEKKQREKEKKREKKRALAQQKEEERLKKEAEKERLEREKREEMIRKTEEGRKRKEEEERRKKEEKRRKEEEEERRRREKEEKKRQKEEQKRKEEEEKLRKEAEEKRRQEEALRLKKEEEETRVRKMQEDQEAKLLQERLRREEEELQRQQMEYAKHLEEQQLHLQHQHLQERSNSNISLPEHHPSLVANPLFDNMYPQSSFMASPGVPQNQASLLPQTTTPPFGTTAAPTAPPGSSFFTPRLSDPSAAPVSPWLANPPAQPINAAPKPLDPTFGTGMFSDTTSQVNNGLDEIIGSLASTKLDSFNTAGGLFSTRNVWSTDVPSNGWSAAKTATSSLSGPSGGPTATNPTASASPFNAFGPTALTNDTATSTLGLNGSLWGTSTLSTQSTPGLNSTFAPTQPPAPQPLPQQQVDELLKTYQSQIFKAYQYLYMNNPEHVYVGVDALYRAFSSLFEHQTVPSLDLFLQIVQSDSESYKFEVVRDGLGSISHVKCSQLSPMPFAARTNSVGFGGFGDVALNSGVGANAAHGSTGGLFSLNSGLSSTWGGF